MPGITLDLAQAQLELYMKAEAAVLSGQSYEIHGRKLTRANLGDIQRGIATWNDRILGVAKPAPTNRSRVIVPGW